MQLGEGILSVDAQHKAQGAVTWLSSAKHRDYENDHHFIPPKLCSMAKLRGI